MKITEVKNFPSKLLSKKKITFYKAFLIKNFENGQIAEMKVRTDVDLLAVTEEDAVAELIRESITSMLSGDLFENCLKGQVVSIASFTMQTDRFKEEDVLDEGEPKFENGLLSITLNGKVYDIEVYDKLLRSYTMTIDENEKKTITDLVLEDL